MATFVLLGLRHEADVIQLAFEGVREMEESTTYQLILRRGEARGVRETLLQVGEGKPGAPRPATVEALGAITDVARLRALAGRLRDVESWDALLAE